ncbi:hypothetical protein Q3G72_016484 [Acer saccharum]|nr:hypothetical protein Q3G72_016484 [Acer saccharum]
MNQIKQVHAQIILQGLTNQSLTLGKLIAFCAVNHAGNLEYAQLVFDQLKEPNKFMYNSLIRGYSNSDNNQVKAVLLYREMVNMGHSPNEFTLPFVLKACAFQSMYWVAVLVHGHACSQVGDLAMGKKVHDYAFRASRKPAFEIRVIGELIDVNSQMELQQGLIAAGDEASSSNNNNNKANKSFQETKETSQSPNSFRKRSRKGVPVRSPSK